MKKRIKGLVALWIALVMAAASLATVWAASENTVYIYYGKEQLIDGKQFVYNASDEEQGLYHLSNFKAGDLLNESLLDNIPVEYVIPEGYKLDGWKVWKYSSAAEVYFSETKGLGDTIPSSDFFGPDESNTSSGKYYDSDSAERLILEPVLKLTYEITHQPKDAEPYVTTNTDIDKISNYEWYAVNTVEYDVVKETVGDNQIAADTIWFGNFDPDSGKWSAAVDSGKNKINIKLNLQEGDNLQIIPAISDSEADILVKDYNNTVSFSKNEKGIWSSLISYTNYEYVDLYIESEATYSVQIKVIRDIISENAVEGQNTYKLTGSQGTYLCKVKFTNGASLISDRFTYTGYGISCNETSYGSYRVLVDGVEVEKTNSGNTVTIETTPGEGYELDGINVKKTADGSTVEMVTDNSFTMPDYPVTIDVTFKKKTYAVTLPEAPVGYTVESSQISPVEHGSTYTFTVTLEEGYGTSGSFEVKANTTTLTATKTSEKVYTYTVNNVTAAQKITVSGVMKEHNITKSSTTNGEYTVKAGENEADKAVAGTTVTVTATPVTGYELAAVKVISTDDGSTNVTVTDNSFTMPDYPVTIDVTFRKKTYAVTLPETTVGYTVESSQTSLVEHGSDYTFTVTLDDEYAASSNFVVKANETTLTATKTSEKVYTYIINNVTAAQEITVSGVMKEHNITKSSTANGEYTVKAGENEADKAVAGTTVTVTATPVTGYELDAIKVTSTNDGSTNVTVTDNSFTMPDYPVTIDVTFRKKTYTVTLPEATVGYTVESSQTSPVEYGSDYSFTVILGEGYAAASDFVVKENTSVLTAIRSSENTYVYIIKNVTENKIVTVSGIVEGTAPTIKITLDENNWWQSFLNKITFNLFFKNSRSLTIEAFDGESGIDSVWYHLTDTDLFPEDKSYTAKEIEDVITQWNEYKDNTGSISLPKDGRYVMYVKAVDKEGKVSFASTTGIVVDTTAPVIADIEDGGTYYGDITFTISDEYLDSILVDQKPVDVKKDTESVTITADNDTHTVQVTDKAGNSVTYTIDVYAKWVSEGISSEGQYELKPGIPYKLDSGKWKVVGDNTVYEGGSTFYVHESGTYEFQKQ